MNALAYVNMMRRGASLASLGAFDPDVLAAQKWLNEQGVTDDAGAKLVEDGLIGPKTNAALAKTGWTVAQVAQIARDMAAGAKAPPNPATKPSWQVKLADLAKNKKVWIALGGLVVLLLAMKFMSKPQSQTQPRLAGTTPPRRRRRR